MKDTLGTRMKENYENCTRYYLPKRTNTIIRIDGKAFHSFTRNCEKPYDEHFMNAMNFTAENLLKSIQGSVFAYVQSDEISILLQDYENEKTLAWLNGNIQKIASISASIATGYFNEYYRSDKIAFFDSRAFTICDNVEVYNYFLWRLNDCVRNSIQSLAHTLFSHKELLTLNQVQLINKCADEHNIFFSDMPNAYKYGRIIKKQKYIKNDIERTKYVTFSYVDALTVRHEFQTLCLIYK